VRASDSGTPKTKVRYLITKSKCATGTATNEPTQGDAETVSANNLNINWAATAYDETSRTRTTDAVRAWALDADMPDTVWGTATDNPQVTPVYDHTRTPPVFMYNMTTHWWSRTSSRYASGSEIIEVEE
jgi:hypothetical protein